MIDISSARIKRNKNNEITGYEIRVSRGYDASGKQITPYSTIWKLPEGWNNWSKKKQDKELEIAKAKFELACQKGEVKTRAEKKAEEAEKEKLTIQQQLEKDSEPTFDEAFELYINKTKSQKKINTIVGIKTTIKRALVHFKNQKLKDITENDCQEYIDFLLDECELAILTVIKHYKTLSAFFNWCVKDKLLEYNPLRGVVKPVDNSGNIKIKTFTIEEIKKIVEYIENEELIWQVATYLLIDSGIRRGELIGMRWCDINLETGRIDIINNTQYAEGYGIYDTNTKSGKSRVVFINDIVIEKLKQWKAFQKEIIEGQGLPSPVYIFTHLDGKRLSPQAPTVFFKDFGEKYGIEDCHPHKFRHTMATLMIQNGADIKTVSEKLGHSNIEITLKLYVHTNEEAQKAANNKFADLIW